MRRYALIILVAALWSLAMARDGLDAWVDRAPMPDLRVELSVEVRDRHGALLRAYTVDNGRWRMGARVEDVDPTYLDLLIAYEDRRFYTHNGVDPRAMLRAAWQSLRAGRVVSGASTLTMQTARLIEDGPTGEWGGKIRQMRLALALERRLSKRDILNLYLIHAPFGGNVEGIRAASLMWFAKPPARLTPAEAALLVALPQSPETRRPDRHLPTAIAARDRVLARGEMAGLFDADTTAAARREGVPRAMSDMPILAPHLSDMARADKSVNSVHILTIEATLQAHLQTLLAEAMLGQDPHVSAALVVADHQTGQVLAAIGAADFTDVDRRGFVNMLTASRSPASTLKPFVYGLAFDDGLAHPETRIVDRPVRFDTYAPQNFDGEFRGDITLRRALHLSLNTPVVQVLDRFGPARLMQTLRDSGAAPELSGGQPGLAIALGGLGVSLMDLVQAYGALGNGGVARPLVWRMGEEVEEGPRLIGETAAWYVTDILRETPRPVNAPTGDIAYKTGTSYGHRDAWAIGYDARHVIGVWIGRPDGTSVPGAFGAEAAAPILFQAFGILKPAPDRFAAPPEQALIVSTGELPPPLRRFGVAPSDLNPTRAGLSIAFPPDGARLRSDGGGVPLRLMDGVPPFAVLVNGVPVAPVLRGRDMMLPDMRRGFSDLSVIDADGTAVQITVEVE